MHNTIIETQPVYGGGYGVDTTIITTPSYNYDSGSSFGFENNIDTTIYSSPSDGYGGGDFSSGYSDNVVVSSYDTPSFYWFTYLCVFSINIKWNFQQSLLKAM